MARGDAKIMQENRPTRFTII